ncbi:Hypothetical predicted protein [Podarcis lilfordi]|uniref:Uncharacterized protein n=1 Tax=Podarcis lilfordi TaxID=74358 RepID=A0AA35KP95_9SAUR|nr:Hypothetical predicted protein [Podarcis lilfordi]
MDLMYIYSKLSCCKTDMCNSGPPEGGADILGALRGCATATFCNRTDWLFEYLFERLSIAVIHAECTKAMEDDANELVAEGRQTSTAQKNPPFMENGGLVVEEGRSKPEDSQAFFPEV